MGLDASTLAVVACITNAVVAALMMFSWWQDRKTVALGWWSLSFACGAAASLLYVSNAAPLRGWGHDAGGVLFVLGFGLAWGAACRFNGRAISWAPIATAPLALAALLWGVEPDFYARMVVVSLIVAAFCAGTAHELWSNSSRDLPSRRAAAGVTAAVGAYFFVRPLLGIAMTPWIGDHPPQPTGDWASTAMLVTLLQTMVFGYLVMSMAREKADQEHRMAALVDPLTGVCNRRAFMVEGQRRVEHGRRAGLPMSLVMFDLDHFKAINDSHGHLIGDHTLVEFCAIARTRLPEEATLARLGGEEFAVLLEGVGHDQARSLAEDIRRDLESLAAVVMGRPVAATVSAGVASGADDSQSLGMLLAAADAALYEAKARGRNCVVTGCPSADRLPGDMPGAPAFA